MGTGGYRTPTIPITVHRYMRMGAGVGSQSTPAQQANTDQSLVVVWYYVAGHSPTSSRSIAGRARWYATKTHPSYQDMLTELRRALIAAQCRVDPWSSPPAN